MSGESMKHRNLDRNWKLTAGTLCLAGIVAGAFFVGRAVAGVPASDALTYSGTLQGANGAPITGDHDVEVRFWDGGSTGTQLCTSGVQTLTLELGRFSVPLPDACTEEVKLYPDIWAEVVVDTVSLGRAKIGAVPYAIEAFHASTASAANNATGTLESTLLDHTTRITTIEEGLQASKVLDTNGTLPHTSSSFTVSGGPVVLYVAGSGYRGADAGTLQILVEVDNVVVDSVSSYTNEIGSHKAVVPKAIPLTLAAGAHTVRLSAGAGLLSDTNDYFTVTVLELPD